MDEVIIVALTDFHKHISKGPSLIMPQAVTEAKCLFGEIFLLPSLVDCKSNSYPTNVELLEYATQPLEDEIVIYPT